MRVLLPIFVIATLAVRGQEAPKGKYLYIQPPPLYVEFENNELSLKAVKNPEAPGGGIEVKPGVITHFVGRRANDGLKALSVISRIKVRKGHLWFEGVKIDFGPIRVLKVREAYRWGSWVVCDGYSSASQDTLKMPPETREGMLPSELIYFKPKERFGKSVPFGVAPLSIQLLGEDIAQ